MAHISGQIETSLKECMHTIVYTNHQEDFEVDKITLEVPNIKVVGLYFQECCEIHKKWFSE